MRDVACLDLSLRCSSDPATVELEPDTRSCSRLARIAPKTTKNNSRSSSVAQYSICAAESHSYLAARPASIFRSDSWTSGHSRLGTLQHLRIRPKTVKTDGYSSSIADVQLLRNRGHSYLAGRGPRGPQRRWQQDHPQQNPQGPCPDMIQYSPQSSQRAIPTSRDTLQYSP